MYFPSLKFDTLFISHPLGAYGDNILSTAEAEKLRNRLTTDADFSTEVIPFLQTVAILRQGRKQYVLAYLRNVENGLPNITFTQRTQYTWFKFAAAAAIIVAFAWLFVAQPNPTSEQTADNIVSEYTQPYTTIGILKDGAITTARAQAMTAYANAEYPKVIQYINSIPDAERMPLDVFYLGYAQLATKDYSKARSLFESIHNQSEAHLLQQATIWHCVT